MDFLNTPEKLNRRLVHSPMGRFGEAIEQALAVVFREQPEQTRRECFTNHLSGFRRLILRERVRLPGRWRIDKMLRCESFRGPFTILAEG